MSNPCLISDWSLEYFSINSCCLAEGIVGTVGGLGPVAGFVVGVVDSGFRGDSLGEASDATFVVES